MRCHGPPTERSVVKFIRLRTPRSALRISCSWRWSGDKCDSELQWATVARRIEDWLRVPLPSHCLAVACSGHLTTEDGLARRATGAGCGNRPTAQSPTTDHSFVVHAARLHHNQKLHRCGAAQRPFRYFSNQARSHSILARRLESFPSPCGSPLYTTSSVGTF